MSVQIDCIDSSNYYMSACLEGQSQCLYNSLVLSDNCQALALLKADDEDNDDEIFIKIVAYL